MSRPHFCSRQLEHPERLEWDAGPCSAPTRSASLSSVLHLNWIKLPGNTRGEGKEICTLWVTHSPHCKRAIKSQNNERAGINVVSSLTAPLGKTLSAVI